jgi:hypothetical protein
MTTSWSRWQSAVAVSLLLVVVPTVRAQQNAPHIGYVYPAGGQRGTTFQVVVGGQFLDGVTEGCFSGAGIQAAVLEHTKPLTQKQFNELREKLRMLQEKRQAAMKGVSLRPAARATDKREGPDLTPSSTEPNKPPVWTAEDARMVAEIRKKLVNAPNRQANPALAERVTLTVTMAPDAEPGERELRLTAAAGLTNPLVFCVGELPEFSERESQGSAGPPQNPRAAQSAVAKTEMNVTLPAVLNGQILPGGVDQFGFTARKGQRLVVAASARELIPYLADAVPGWFQATLTLYDSNGKELAYDDDYRFNPDPVLFYEIPEDGEYVIEIKDSIYRGREDFVYRIAVGELPFVTSIFPLGGRAGTATKIELRGWNLPTKTMTCRFGDAEVGIHQLSVGRDEWASNLVPFAVDTLPECLDQESNDDQEKAQPVTLPTIVNGRIDKSGDSDVFRFEGRGGSEIVAQVYARRLNSPLDSMLELTDAAGRQLAANDDHADKGTGLTTHHADSYLRATLPADGTYCLHLADAQNKGGPEYGYRLRISSPRPDFELRIVPSSVNVRGGMSIPLTVYGLRKDGFNGDITLALKDPPAAVSLSGAWVPAGEDKVQVTLTVPPTPTQEPLSVSLEGRATIDGREVVHPVVPAEDMMQAFFYRHLVPAKELRLSISGRGMSRAPVRVLSETPVKIPAGGTARVRVAAPPAALTGRVQLEVSEPPEGIVIESVGAGLKSARAGQGTDIVLRSDAAKAKAGLKGNLIISAFPAGSAASQKQKVQASRPRFPVTVLPAVPFEIVGQGTEIGDETSGG